MRVAARSLIPLRNFTRNTSYRAPIQDVKFVLGEVLNAYQYFPEECAQDTCEMIIGEAAKFAESVLHPVWQLGDDGVKFDGKDVFTPPGWKEAYAKYVEGGWPSLPAPVDFGGQGFPLAVDMAKSEFCAAANWTWFMYPMLGHGAVECMLAWADPKMKEEYLPKLISGEWTGTMCLTEAQAGSDLGIIKTKAEPVADGTYKISGSKIFISSGDCDFAPNTLHLVLARLPEAPAGTKGISLFLVPKYLKNADGSLQTNKNVECAGIEHKMGIKGSATCVMAFENSVGYLIGKPNEGMKQMFSFMNTARLHVGVQGLGAAELSYQQAVPYAKERLAGRAPSGAKFPNKVADPIIVHPDVRRMLLKIKSFTEGGRCLLYWAALLEDRAHWAKSEKEKRAFEGEMGLLTPVIKAFLSEGGVEMSNEALQVFGGHGYIKEWGMEQILRESRIATIYEGTTGIQSMDLLGRKVMMNRGKDLTTFCTGIIDFCNKNMEQIEMLPHTLAMLKGTSEWMEVTIKLMQMAAKNPDLLQSAAVDYMYFSGYMILGYMWLRMEAVARIKLAEKSGNEEYYKAKIQTSDFYFARMLPRAKGHLVTMTAPSSVLTQLSEENFMIE